MPFVVFTAAPSDDRQLQAVDASAGSERLRSLPAVFLTAVSSAECRVAWRMSQRGGNSELPQTAQDTPSLRTKARWSDLAQSRCRFVDAASEMSVTARRSDKSHVAVDGPTSASWPSSSLKEKVPNLGRLLAEHAICSVACISVQDNIRAKWHHPEQPRAVSKGDVGCGGRA